MHGRKRETRSSERAQRRSIGGAASTFIRQNVVGFVALFVALGGGAYATHTHRMGTQDLRNNAVTTPKIRGGAVTAQKLRNNAVRPRKVATDAIRTRHVLDGTITTPKLADGAVTAQKLAGDVGPGGTPTGPAGGDLTGNYPNPLIADGAVGTEKIALGANGVALAAVNVDGSNGNVRSFFNRLGGEPTVNRTAAGRYVISIPGLSIPEPNAAQNVIHMANPSRINGDRTATVFTSGASPAVRTRDTLTAGNPLADANFIYVLYGVFGP
jgi:hypothetical protein